MRRRIIAAIIGLHSLSATLSVAQVHDYWFAGTPNDESMVQFVDLASVTADKSGLRRAWITDYYSAHDKSFGGMHSKTFVEVNCSMKQFRTLQSTYYNSDGSSDPRYSIDEPVKWSYAVPDSMGESELRFICANTAFQREALGANRVASGLSIEQFAKNILSPPVNRATAPAPADYQPKVATVSPASTERAQALAELEAKYPDWRGIIGMPTDSSQVDQNVPFRRWLSTTSPQYQSFFRNALSPREIEAAIDMFRAGVH